jgi:lipoprotein NlpI
MSPGHLAGNPARGEAHDQPLVQAHRWGCRTSRQILRREAIEPFCLPIYFGRQHCAQARFYHDPFWKGGQMSANTASWLSTHGRLWYDDPWYRLAWIVWPQALGLLLFVSLWLNYPVAQGIIPWAKPIVEAPKAPPVAAPVNDPPKQAFVAPPVQQPADALEPCKGNDHAQIIRACTALLASGNLRSDEVPYAYWHRGWQYQQLRQYQPAMDDYNRAIAMAPRIAEFFVDRGELLVDLKNKERALQDFDYAILLKPDYAPAYVDRGITLYDLKRPSEAFVALNKAIELDSKQFLAYEYRASIYEDNENWRAVYDDGVKMIELNPNSRFGYEYRGHAYLEVNQFQSAIADFTKAIALDPSAIYGWRMRGRAYYFLNQFDNAMTDFQAALRIDPKDSDTIDFINDLKRRRGR